jgi:hypothetical protein
MVAGLYWAIAQCTSVLMRPASKLKIICCEDLVLYKDPVNSLHLFSTCALHVLTNCPVLLPFFTLDFYPLVFYSGARLLMLKKIVHVTTHHE